MTNQPPSSTRFIDMLFKVLLNLLFFTIICGAIYWGYSKLRDNLLKGETVVVKDNHEVILERIQNVFKVILVEGEFADVVTYRDFYSYDLPGFRKSALLKVKAKVTVGYDLDSVAMNYDHTTKTINIIRMPAPKILSIDPDIQYYDVSNGLFNSFSPEDLTKLQKSARDTIELKARQGGLLEKASQQSVQMLDMLTFAARETGWNITVEGKPFKPQAVLPQKQNPAHEQ